MRNYWLGGTDNFEADRQAGQAIQAVRPGIADHARENKQFLTRAVTYLAAHGIRQFLDVGAGLPTSPARDGEAAPLWRATHEAARAVVPDATVAYLDHDPVAVEHSRRVLAAQSGVDLAGVVATGGDMLEPEAILADPAVRAAGFDPAEPAGVLLACVLHFVPEPVARDVVARFHRALAPGSYLVVSIGYGQGQAGQDFTRTYNSQDGSQIYSHPGRVRGLVRRPGAAVTGPGRRHRLAAAAARRLPGRAGDDDRGRRGPQTLRQPVSLGGPGRRRRRRTRPRSRPGPSPRPAGRAAAAGP